MSMVHSYPSHADAISRNSRPASGCGRAGCARRIVPGARGGDSRPEFGRLPHDRGGPCSAGACHRRSLPTTVMLLVLAVGHAAVSAGDEPDTRSLPEATYTSNALFSIPFVLEESQAGQVTTRRVILSVSRDLGATWRDVDDVLPNARQFTFRATTDGEYWFRLRAEDSEGHHRGGPGPDVRIILNASGPRLAARAWRGPDGEVICRFAAFDDTLDLASLRLEYRTAEEPAWQRIDAVAMLSRQSPAHLVGEELWWAGDNPRELVIRISIQDDAGNATTQTYTLEASDPGVSQVQLAREIGAPPLPGTEPPPESPPASEWSPQTVAEADGSPWNRARSGRAASDAPWLPGGVDAGWSMHPDPDQQQTAGVKSVLTASRPRGQSSVDFTGHPSPSITASTGSLPDASRSAVTAPQVAPELDGLTLGETASSSLYKGKPLMLSRSRQFTWDYTVEGVNAEDRRSKVILWGTRDGGFTWQQVAVDEDGKSPILVSLDQRGLQGFRLEVSHDGQPWQSPRSGDTPQCWVAIDETPPTVSILSVTSSGEPSQGGEQTFAVSYACDDPLIVPRGGRLQYSPNPAGPWASVAEGLESTGQYLWTPSRTVPARVYLRIEAEDLAGNVGAAVTPEPLAVGGDRPTVQFGSLRPLPAASQP
jgi:hypothetical protein